MNRQQKPVGIRLRLTLAPDTALGPGKADILEGIQTTGSIAAACRRMGMSYKRAWYLVDTLNRGFRSPLVEAVKGGRNGGGARLTPLGEEVLARYRRMEAATARAIAEEVDALRGMLARRPSVEHVT